MNWRGWFLAWVTPLLLLAQLAITVHQLEHRVTPDALTLAHECVLCNVASGAAPPPAPFVVLPPDFGLAVPADAVLDSACCTHVAAAFLARAPPYSAAL